MNCNEYTIAHKYNVCIKSSKIIEINSCTCVLQQKKKLTSVKVSILMQII